MIATGNPAGGGGILARLPGCALVLMSTGFTIAYLFGCNMLDQAPVLVALLLPILYLAAQPATVLADGLVERWFLLALLLLVWMAGVQWLRDDALPAGWIRIAERGAALATCLLVAVNRVPTREMIALMGTSASCVSVLSLVMDGLSDQLHPFYIGNFGLGQINLLCDLAGPVLLAWAAVQIGDALQGRAFKRRDFLIMIVGAVALIVIAIATRRRGMAVAMSLSCLWPVGLWLYQRNRTLAIALALAVATVIAGVAVHLWTEDPPSLRNERISIYRAAMEAIAAGWPFGFGHFGMLHIAQVHGEACRHFNACGGWLQQAHNEFLDIAVDGGPVALLTVLAMTGLIVYRLFRIADPQIRIALQMLGIATTVHLMTDNVFGLAPAEIWLGTIVGLILAAPATDGGPRLLNILPTARTLGAGFTLLSCWGVAHQIAPATLLRDAGTPARMHSLLATREPVIIDVQVSALLAHTEPPLSDEEARLVLESAVHLMGRTSMLARNEADRIIRSGEAQAGVTALLRLLNLLPFYRQAYEELDKLLVRHPELVHEVPADVQRRLAYLTGNARLKAPNLDLVPRTMDDAIDAYAGITWAIINGRPWPVAAKALHALCMHYGDIAGVAQLILQAVQAAPPGTFPWLGEAYPILEVGLRYGFDEEAYFSKVTTNAEALAVMPLIQARHPGVVRDVLSGTRQELSVAPELHNALVRVIHRASPPGVQPTRVDAVPSLVAPQ